MFKDGDVIKVGQIVVNWDLYNYLIVLEVVGFICFIDFVDGIIVIEKIDELIGLVLCEIIDLKCCGIQVKDLCLIVCIVDVKGNDLLILGIDLLVQYLLLLCLIVNLQDGVLVGVGDVVVKILQEVLKICDIIGGLLCVVDLFEVCKLKDLVVLVECLGIISFGKDIKGKQCLIIKDIDGLEYEELILKYCQVIVFEGEYVIKGEIIVDGELSLQDILCLLGVELLVVYLVKEIQDVYCLQGVKINDKYIEVIICQMLCKVEIIDQGSSKFLNGEQVECQCVIEENVCLLICNELLVCFDLVLLGIIKVLLVIELFILVVFFQEII